MNKILIILLLYPASVDATTKVHEYCETKDRFQADLIARIESSKNNAQYCVHINSVCGYVEGKIYFDQKNGVPTYLSSSYSICH